MSDVAIAITPQSRTPLILLTSAIPYSRKYWWSLNLAVWSRAAETKILADLNLAIRHGIIIIMYILRIHLREILADFNLAVVAQTAKLPNLSHCQIFQLYSISLFSVT